MDATGAASTCSAFWARRARRLLPALLLVLVGVVVYAGVVRRAERARPLRGDSLASLGYVANWRFIFARPVATSPFAPPSPLRHMWSLAVEEQFYLVWPLIVAVLVLAGAALAARAVRGVASVLIAASAMVMAVLYAPGSDPSRVYYGTDARAQTLLIGAALAALGPDRTWARAPGDGGRWSSLGVASALFVAWTWYAVDGRLTVPVPRRADRSSPSRWPW